jgi:Tfp pilus assembly protein PilF
VPRPERRAEPEPPPPSAPAARTELEPQGSPELLAGIRAYEEGKHREAAMALRRALSTRLTKAEQVKAHKYLAFIDCSARRTKECREEFAKALKIDPSFDLEPAEAGHPLWGPVFRSVKGAKRR